MAASASAGPPTPPERADSLPDETEAELAAEALPPLALETPELSATLGEASLEHDLAEGDSFSVPASSVQEITQRRDRLHNEFTELFAFEAARKSAMEDEIAIQTASRDLLFERMLFMALSVEQLVDDANAHISLCKSSAEGLDALAKVPNARGEHGTMGEAIRGLRAHYAQQAAIQTNMADYIASEVVKRLKKLHLEILKENKGIKAKLLSLKSEFDTARARVDAQAKALAKMHKSNSRAQDPWLAEQRYKQALRWHQGLKTAYSTNMSTLFSAIVALDARRIEITQIVLSEYITAQRVRAIQGADSCDAPKAVLVNVRPATDTAAFVAVAFPDGKAPKAADPVADSKYISFASTQVVKHGYLSIEHGALFTSWLKHLFILTTFGYLHFFEEGKKGSEVANQAPVESFALWEFSVEEAPAKAGEGAFELRQRVRGWFSRLKVLIVRADSVEAKADWIRAIRTVIAASNASGDGGGAAPADA